MEVPTRPANGATTSGNVCRSPRCAVGILWGMYRFHYYESHSGEEKFNRPLKAKIEGRTFPSLAIRPNETYTVPCVASPVRMGFR